jgi:uncharacterized membrane protein YeaQ/YmgE (transglycosylase-associated protein family)
MLAYIVVGIILGWLAWQLKHGKGIDRLINLMIFGIVGSVIGGVGMDLFIRNDLGTIKPSAWGFTAAAIVSLVVLGLVQSGVGRKGK